MSSILITGGTGSFGKAFAELLLKQCYVDRIVIYSRDEHKQEKMAAELNSDRLRFFIGDIRDKDRLKLAMQDCVYIVHAAALKVVPTGEYNPQEFIKTNILGSQNIIDILAEDHKRSVGRLIALSTDKAVNPINLYGGTKFVMEKLVLAGNNLMGDRDIRCSVVRYGNVANSNGSVIHKFKECMARDELLPITDHEMTRYWIELDEAAEFVMNNLWNMRGREVFIPNMPSFKIMDLARAFHCGDKEFPHKIIGIRKGEKLHEQIDLDKYSNINDVWLSWSDLNDKLMQMGVLHDTI